MAKKEHYWHGGADVCDGGPPATDLEMFAADVRIRIKVYLDDIAVTDPDVDHSLDMAPHGLLGVDLDEDILHALRRFDRLLPPQNKK